MSEILSKSKHAGLTYKPMHDYSFTAGQNAVPLLASEVLEAARYFPVIFPNPHSAEPHALLGLGSVNVFVDEDGKWKAPYVPTGFSNYPFSIAKAHLNVEADDGQTIEMTLGIVEDAPHFHQADGLPLYGPEGEPAETLRRILAVMQDQLRSYHASEPALAELQASGVLERRALKVRHHGKEHTLTGLRIANREKVMGLSDEILGRWSRIGIMEMLYAHWQSMRNMDALLKHPSCPIKAE